MKSETGMGRFYRLLFLILATGTQAFALSGDVLSPEYATPDDSLVSAAPSRMFVRERLHRMSVEIEHESGGMIPNNSKIRDLRKDIYYNGFNLKLGWQRKSANVYAQIYNYPTYGIGFYTSSFGLKDFGNPVAFFGYVSIPVKPRMSNRWKMNYRIGLGLSGNFKPYDDVNNQVNVLIGSKQNVYVDLGYQVHYRLGRRFKIGGGLAFHHFSNGAMKLPNKGINLIPLTLSVSYTPTGENRDTARVVIPPHQENTQWHVHYAVGVKQLREDNPASFLKSTVGLYYSYSMGYKWRIGAGMDLFYSRSGQEEWIAGDRAGKFGALFSYGPALYFDHVLARRLYLNGNIGVYLKRNSFNGEVAPYFLRIGVRYKVFSEVYAGVSIKAHAGKADFVEWTLGYGFGKRSRRSGSR